ncbi:MAG: DNA polymerase ligase N-terminal domain-containing protein [Planctomycetaceae bacterium]
MNARFVILIHDHPTLHWDFLLENSNTDLAATWRLLQEPKCNVWISAQRIHDHRRMYLNYEGPVTMGRGTVKKLASGLFSLPCECLIFEPDGSTMLTEHAVDLTEFRFHHIADEDSQAATKWQVATFRRNEHGEEFWRFM